MTRPKLVELGAPKMDGPILGLETNVILHFKKPS
jgi:hypothetical protein